LIQRGNLSVPVTPKQLLRDALQLPILVQLITQVGDILVVQTVTVLQELVRLSLCS